MAALEHRDTSSVLYIGRDEISRKRGHVYHTVNDVRKAEARELR